MKGKIIKMINRLSKIIELPISVTDAIYEGDKTQKEINGVFSNRIDAFSNRMNLMFINPEFKFFNQVNHRGGVNYPENTLPAFRHSIEQGFKYCECDVRVTSDGKFVALHDETIDRTSNGTGDVSSKTYEQLQSFDFGSWKGEQFAGTKIPLIRDVVLLCKEKKVMIELDCVGRLTEQEMCNLYDELNHYGLLSVVSICGSEEEILWLYNSNRRNVAVSVSFLNQTPSSSAILNLSHYLDQMLCVNVSINKQYLTTSIIDAIRTRGWNVKTWTISNDAELKNYYNMGCDTILINSDSLYTL